MEDLIKLKHNIQEPDGKGLFDDSMLIWLLEDCGGDVNLASYRALLYKAEFDDIRLPDGIAADSSHEYWLRLARLFRPNQNREVERQ